MENLSPGDCSIAMSPYVAGSLCARFLEQAGNDVQKFFLEPFMAGERIPAFCLTEPGSGTDSAPEK